MIQYKGGNGSSKEKAVIIVGAESELGGVDAQFEYIERKCGFFEIESQSFFDEGDRKFDCLNVIGVTGNKEELWFDVTDYYGMDDD
jgi:hypothetical protein